jgi:hypothetical protein
MSGSMIRMSEKKSLFVRARDILYVTNASDEDWWQAKR